MRRSSCPARRPAQNELRDSLAGGAALTRSTRACGTQSSGRTRAQPPRPRTPSSSPSRQASPAARASGAIDAVPEDVLVIVEAVGHHRCPYSNSEVLGRAFGPLPSTATATLDETTTSHSGPATPWSPSKACDGRWNGGAATPPRGLALWVYAASFTGAALTGYFRMASDNHWLMTCWPARRAARASASWAPGFTEPARVV